MAQTQKIKWSPDDFDISVSNNQIVLTTKDKANSYKIDIPETGLKLIPFLRQLKNYDDSIQNDKNSHALFDKVISAIEHPPKPKAAPALDNDFIQSLQERIEILQQENSYTPGTQFKQNVDRAEILLRYGTAQGIREAQELISKLELSIDQKKSLELIPVKPPETVLKTETAKESQTYAKESSNMQKLVEQVVATVVKFKKENKNPQMPNADAAMSVTSNKDFYNIKIGELNPFSIPKDYSPDFIKLFIILAFGTKEEIAKSPVKDERSINILINNDPNKKTLFEKIRTELLLSTDDSEILSITQAKEKPAPEARTEEVEFEPVEVTGAKLEKPVEIEKTKEKKPKVVVQPVQAKKTKPEDRTISLQEQINALAKQDMDFANQIREMNKELGKTYAYARRFTASIGVDGYDGPQTKKATELYIKRAENADVFPKEIQIDWGVTLDLLQTPQTDPYAIFKTYQSFSNFKSMPENVQVAFLQTGKITLRDLESAGIGITRGVRAAARELEKHEPKVEAIPKSQALQEPAGKGITPTVSVDDILGTVKKEETPSKSIDDILGLKVPEKTLDLQKLIVSIKSQDRSLLDPASKALISKLGELQNQGKYDEARLQANEIFASMTQLSIDRANKAVNASVIKDKSRPLETLNQAKKELDNKNYAQAISSARKTLEALESEYEKILRKTLAGMEPSTALDFMAAESRKSLKEMVGGPRQESYPSLLRRHPYLAQLEERINSEKDTEKKAAALEKYTQSITVYQNFVKENNRVPDKKEMLELSKKRSQLIDEIGAILEGKTKAGEKTAPASPAQKEKEPAPETAPFPVPSEPGVEAPAFEPEPSPPEEIEEPERIVPAPKPPIEELSFEEEEEITTKPKEEMEKQKLFTSINQIGTYVSSGLDDYIIQLSDKSEEQSILGKKTYEFFIKKSKYVFNKDGTLNNELKKEITNMLRNLKDNKTYPEFAGLFSNDTQAAKTISALAIELQNKIAFWDFAILIVEKKKASYDVTKIEERFLGLNSVDPDIGIMSKLYVDLQNLKKTAKEKEEPKPPAEAPKEKPAEKKPARLEATDDF